MHRADARAELFGGLLLLHAAQHQLDCPSPGLQWDDGFGHMASIPGIHRQPTLQTLPGRITQMLHHLGRRHRRGEIQLHRTLSFLKTEHTKIFPFGLQENVRSPNYLSQHLLNLEGVSSPNELRIPGNLFIWATMNNADQGVMFMDSAFKRRWDFEYETISLSLNEKLKTSQIIYNNETHSLLQILSSVNNKLREKRPPVPEDRLIGQFFLPEEALRSEAGIRGAFKKVLIYLWDDVLRNDRNEFFDANVDSLSYLFANYQTKDVLDIEESLKKTLSEEAQPEDHSEPDTNEFEENDGQDA